MEDLIKEFLGINFIGSGYGLNSIINDKNHLYDYRKGFLSKEIHSLKSFNGKPVYYIDDIPCCFLAIVGNVAKVNIIKDDFSTEIQYVAKQGDLFAHGKTKKDALADAEFISKFKKSDIHKVNTFFDWHGVLTGSCRAGRLNFAQSRSLSMESDMSVLDFLQLTKDQYNGDIIKGILSDID